MTTTTVPRNQLWWHPQNVVALRRQAAALDPNVELVRKDESRLWQILAWIVAIFTLGRIPRKKVLEGPTVTIGRRVYIPATWSAYPVEDCLPHEILGHAQQYKRMGLGSYWLGIAPFLIVYFVLPVPAGYALGRALLEIQAVRADWDHEGSNREYWPQGYMSLWALQDDAQRWANRLSSRTYFWALPKEKALDLLYMEAASHVAAGVRRESKARGRSDA